MGRESDPPEPNLAANGIESIRATAKWLVVAFGATAAALLTGVQLTDLRAADQPALALGGFGIAFIAVVVAIWTTSEVLRPRSLSPRRLESDHDAKPLRKAIADDDTLLEGHESLRALVTALEKRRDVADRAWEQPGVKIDGHPDLLAALQAEDALNQVQDTVNRVTDLGLYLATFRAFATARIVLTVAALVAAAGAATFSYATSPEASAPPATKKVDSPS